MTATLDPPAPDGTEEQQADFLPESYGAPVAAGPEIDSFEARSSRLEGGRFRRPIPTERLLAEGVPMPGDDLAVTVEEEKPTEADTRTRWQRLAGSFESVDPRKIPGNKTPLLVFGLIAVFASWDDAALGLIAPELRAEFGLSVQTLVNFGAATSVLALLGGLPIGYLVDRVKRVRLVRIGMIGGNIASLLQALAATQAMFFGARIVGLTTESFSSPATFPLMADYYPSRARARVSAFLGICRQIGQIVALPVAGYLVMQYGWRQAVLALAVFATVISVMTFLLREPVRGGMDRLEMGASRERAAIEQEAPSLQEALRNAWAIRTLRRQAYVSVAARFTQPVTIVLGLIQAEKFFLDAQQRAWLQTATALLAIPALALGGALADRLLSYRPATLVSMQAGLFFLSAATTVMNGLFPNLFLFLFFSFMTGALGSMISPASATISSLVIPARVRGVGMQIFVPFSLVGTLVGPVLVRYSQGLSLQQALMMFSPFYVIAGFIVLSTATTIERDIRNARAASLADDEIRRAKEQGQDKLLVCRDVDVEYDGVQILFNIDLDVSAGECLALLGTNGAGKSTLLRAIAGSHEASNGAIFFDGRDITHVPAHENAQRGIVMMPGGQAVFPTMTVRENLTTAAWMIREDRVAVTEGIERVLTYFPILRERLDLPAGSMSGGEQQMLALGQAFLMRPRLLMIDELSLGLAPSVIEQLLGIVRDLVASGTTVLLVEQSLNVALTIAERAVFMEKGEIHFDGPTADLLRRPDLVRSIFMGGAAGGAAPRTRRRTPVEADAAPALVAESISVSFGGVSALHDVDLEVRAGEIVGVIGPNGAGKTTLFDVLSGFTNPDSGRVLLDGDDLAKLGPDARARLGLGRAFQNAKLFGPLTVRETIAVALERRTVKNPVLGALWAPPVRQSERRIASRADAFIEILGLEAHADKFIRELSTGTRRAVEVACQMAAEPKVLLLDEPSSGLAQAETEALGPALLRVARETGCALLVIEHDLPLIMQLSERLVAMELGQVLATGAPEEVVADPLVLRSYLAASNDVIERSGSRVGQVLSVLTAQEEPPEVTGDIPQEGRTERDGNRG